MDTHQRVLLVDATTRFYRVDRYAVGEPFFGPVDLGLHLSGRYNSLNLGTGLLAGSIFPGSNRLIITGFSPAWGGFYVSTMGGAALVFDNLGINMLSIVGQASVPSVLYLNRKGGEHVEVEIVSIDLTEAWEQEPGGIYGLMQLVYERYRDRYETAPRILCVGRAAAETDFGAIGSAPISDGQITRTDTWAGRGGFGSKLLQQHGICAIIYGGTFVDEDFRDRKVADQWFVDRYEKRLIAVDFEATTKYRFDPGFETGGTFGVNYAKMSGRIMYFNYRSIYDREEDRLAIHERFIKNHYLKQFNEETIGPKQQTTCGEPCAAVCKKLRDEYKKDYEPYQTLGPLVGVFDQRAAERLNRHADTYGFDADLGRWCSGVADGVSGYGGCNAAGIGRRGSSGLSGRWIRRRGRLGPQCPIGGRTAGFDHPPPRLARHAPRSQKVGSPSRSQQRSRAHSTHLSIRRLAATAGWSRISIGPPVCSRRWPLWASITTITASTSPHRAAWAGSASG